ncbi:MAG: hypothetical protein JXA42_15640 [Anaerolineales bacterium]|nr:hypothetical protein [Anaerolineales bacterium]
MNWISPTIESKPGGGDLPLAPGNKLETILSTATKCVRRSRLALLSIFVLLTRLPWLSSGYGADPDSYGLITAAKYIRETGQYTYSRPPGYPIHEFAIAAIVNSGVSASNFCTALMSCVAFFFFAQILKTFRIKPYLLVALSFTLVPVIYINSTNTIDYIWALAFILGSVYFILIQRPILAGFFLGAATGCRITSVAMLIPLCVWLFMQPRDSATLKTTLKFIFFTLFIGAICYLPSLCRYGTGFIRFADNRSYPIIFTLTNLGVVNVWGYFGTLLLLYLVVSFLFSTKHISKTLSKPDVKKGIIFCLTVIIIYAALFLRLPHESGYLAPIVPFMLLGISLVISTTPLTIFVVLLMLSPFFLTIEGKNIYLAGPIFQDQAARVQFIRKAHTAIDFNDNTKSIIVCGSYLPAVNLSLNPKDHTNHKFIYLIKSAGEFDQYIQEGYTIFYIPGVEFYNYSVYNIDLRTQGAAPLAFTQ